MWIPCSGLREYGGLPWLPRLIEKGRRYQAGIDSGADMMNGYLFGDNDYIDRKLLDFLHTDDTAVSALVRTHGADAAVAAELVRRSKRTAQECRTFGIALRRGMFDFYPLEADEGRLPPGARVAIARFVYNRLMMPIVYGVFAAAERKRGRA